MKPHRWARRAVVLAVLAGATCLAQAQAIKLVNVVELSGPGASAGTNFRNGVELAVKEINAAGGVLGQRLETVTYDTQSNPGVAKSMAQKAVADGAFAVFGPVFSGSVIVSMVETKRAGVPNFTGAEGAAITQQDNPYIFRTSFTQVTAMPKVVRYMANNLKAKSVAVIFTNNDFGKGGRDAVVSSLQAAGVKVAAEIATDSGQTDFAAPVSRAKQSDADVLFVYANEEESARILRELRKQAYAKPIVGESTLTGQKVIDLAGEAANGVVAHVGLTVDAPVPAMRAFRAKFEKEYKSVSDHNGIKGYTGVYVLKSAIEQAGKADRRAVAQAMKGLRISAAKQPGVILDVSYDVKGDLDRESFIVEVKGGKQEVREIVPALVAK